jgi:acyl-CoA thioester hydrolase
MQNQNCIKKNELFSNHNSENIYSELLLTVKTYDIDIAGHVNNIVFIRWIEDLRNELFNQIFPLKKLLEINYYPVVVSTEIKYKKQIKLFDKPVGKMELNSYSHGVLLFKTEITIDNYIAFIAT